MSDTPWWLESGPETCQFCMQTFCYEVGYHCVYCDRPICPACVEARFESRDTACPECHEQAATHREKS